MHNEQIEVHIPASSLVAHVFYKTLYKVISNYDLNEGRGGQYTVGWFMYRIDAERAARGNYVMGTDCPIEEVQRNIVVIDIGDGKCNVCVLGEDINLTYVDPREVKARALAKLTNEERAALGL